jgi:hypothetical protein
MAHSSFEKYFCDFLLFCCLATAGWSCDEDGKAVSEARSAASSADIGGGGGNLIDWREECIEMNGGRDDGAFGEAVGVVSGSEDESSFSQAISGVHTRSGRERTTIGGARSASRCLMFSLMSQITMYGSLPGHSDAMESDGRTEKDGRHEEGKGQ